MDCQKELQEAHAAFSVVTTRLNGNPTTSKEWLIIGLQLKAAARAANKVADTLRRKEKRLPV
jgi:hypothetical protein